MKKIATRPATLPKADGAFGTRTADGFKVSETLPVCSAESTAEDVAAKIVIGSTELSGAYSIAEFCKAHGDFTRQHFHSLIKQGRGPRIFKVGKRTLISRQAAAEWILKMEAMTADALHMAA